MDRIAPRWKLGILMSLGILINYIDRVNISHALIPLSKELNLSQVQQGVVLSAFSWGYVALMPVGGVLVDRWGAVFISTGAATVWSLATAWSGIAHNFVTMFMSRLFVGVGEAPIFPADARLVHDEFPLNERGKATALFDAGSYVGIALCAPIVVIVMTTFGWRISFLACSCFGLIWAVVWSRCAPRLQTATLSLDCKLAPQQQYRLGFKRLIVNRKVLGASFGFFCYNYSKSFYLTWFPTYLVTERGFSFLKVGIVGMIPPLFAVIGESFSGAWTDWMISRGVSITVARKTPLCIGMLLGSTIMLTEVVTSQWAILSILSFAFAATISSSPSIWTIPGDLAPLPNYVGAIGGIQNTFSNLAGIIAPVITGLLVAKTGSFSIALIVTAVVAVSGSLSYWFVVGELRPLWGDEL